MDLNQVDVSVLHVQEGDVLVLQFGEVEDDYDDSFFHGLVAHIHAVLKDAGHEKVGVLLGTGPKIEITIVRPDQ